MKRELGRQEYVLAVHQIGDLFDLNGFACFYHLAILGAVIICSILCQNIMVRLASDLLL